MKTGVEKDARLTEKERPMLAEAYKKASHARRNSLRRILSVDRDEDDYLSRTPCPKVSSLYEKVLVELSKVCREIRDFRDKLLIPKADTL